ncbi:MAG: hypothetical protein ACOX16_05640 [Candidatus Izemoplasmatales bacterium]|jgi:hypothetical protein
MKIRKLLGLGGYFIITAIGILGIVINSLALSGSDLIDLGMSSWQTIFFLVVFSVGTAIGIYNFIKGVSRLIKDININKENK